MYLLFVVAGKYGKANRFIYLSNDRTVGVVVRDTPVGVGGLGFDSQAGRIGHSRQQLTSATMFLRSCVARVLGCVEGSPLVTRLCMVSRV